MTNYPAWKRRNVAAKWRSLLAIFITITLLFAIFNGLIKSFSLKKYLGQSRWDGRSSFVTVLSTSPPSVFIYQREPARMAVLKLSGDVFLATPNSAQALIKVSDLASESGEELAEVLSLAFGAEISNFVNFDKELAPNQESLVDLFRNFASLETPLIIATKGAGQVKDTNITRVDLIKLWWRLKGLSTQKLQIVDLAPLVEEVITGDGRKVLGADEASWHQKISQYLENSKLVEKDLKITIKNASGIPAAAKLAADFATSVGLNVVAVEAVPERLEKSRLISAENDYAAGYLAKVFKCDIVGASKEAAGGQITILVGRDFASRYFQ